MITDAILWVLESLLSLLLAPLPDGTFSLDSLPSLSTWVQTNLAPINAVLPLSDMAAAIELVVLVWLPAAGVYLLVSWVYRHLPVVGGGG